MYEFRNKTLEKMSGGMKQRVLLAQSLLNNPSLLVLDEPTAGVDPQERVNIRNYIHSIAKDRIVLISTHIISDIEMIANEIIIMNHGKFLCTLDDEENVEDAYLKWIGDKRYNPQKYNFCTICSEFFLFIRRKINYNVYYKS